MKYPPVDHRFHIAERHYRPRVLDQFGHVYDEVTEAYFALLEASAPKVELPRRGAGNFDIGRLVPRIGQFYPTGTFPSVHALPPAAHDAASNLFKAIVDAVYSAYARGLDHGRDALAQLARGEITAGEFEKKVPTKVHRDVCGRVAREEEA